MGKSREARLVVGLSVAMALVISGCSSASTVAKEDLATVVARDGVEFTDEAIPEEFLDRLAENRVVILGETHHLREHWELTADLLRELHGDGFRQLLVEQPQMADWWLDDYVNGGQLEPGLEPPANWRRKFDAIRDFNATLPAAERIHVRAIDVNEEYYGGAESFRGLIELVAGHLDTPTQIEAFIQLEYATSASQAEAIESLRTSLESDRAALTESWGEHWYDTVVEMVAVEAASIDIRADTDDEASIARESVIKQLADARIDGYPHNTLVNIGGHHAQKSHLMGTEQEWLGDYLVHRSSSIDGSVFVVCFTSAKTELLPGAGGTTFDVLDASPENEVRRLMVETWPGQTVFLPLDDPLFLDREVAFNSEEIIYATPLNAQFDAIVQYGIAHRMPAE